jgi:hypothetical protein
MMANERFLPMDELEGPLARLRKLLEKQDAGAVRKQLIALVPDYTPASENVDWLRDEAASGPEDAATWQQSGVVGVAG